MAAVGFIRSILMVLAVLAFTGPVRAEAGSWSLDYQLHAGGLRLLRASMVIDLSADTYAVRLDARLDGLPAIFSDWWATTVSDGSVAGQGILPRHHRVQRIHRGKVRTTDMAFRPDGTIGVGFDPPRDPVRIAPSELEGAIDPLSALVAMIVELGAGGECSGTLKAFDGRRRFDLIFAEGPRATLKAGPNSPYEGPARRCRMRQVPVAGAWEWEAEEQDSAEAPRERVADLWLAAPIEGGPVVPVRAEGDVWIGRFLLHLVDASRNPVPAGQ